MSKNNCAILCKSSNNSKLCQYVSEQVAKASGDLQHPTVDRDNITYSDLKRIWGLIFGCGNLLRKIVDF
jgi:hypothetical protein